MLKKIILVIILILWLAVIYYSSSMNADESGNKSGAIIKARIITNNSQNK